MIEHRYKQQLIDKKNYITNLFSKFSLPKLEIFDSPYEHYRMRVEFRIWHEGDEYFYAMFEQGKKASGASLIRCDQFPAAHQSINTLMPKLLEAVSAEPILKQRWYAVEFLATLSGEMLVTMIYHKSLDDEWQNKAKQLQNQFGIWIIGRSRGQKIVLTQDFVTEKLVVSGEEFTYKQIEGGFTQPNAYVCQKMLSWACDCTEGLSGDLLELYCGNGNFTLPLSRHFQHVLATEISKTSVDAAKWNIQENHCHNIKMIRLSAEEFTNAYIHHQPFRRLKEQSVVLADYTFSTIFVDPPRAGLDEGTLALVKQFDNIIYVSCNPLTLCDNISILSQTHRIKRFALFDQFPFTSHVESGCLLSKIK